VDAALSPEDRVFANGVRDFIRQNLDPSTRGKVLLFQLPGRAERTVWQRALVAKGWGAPTWPVEFGGPGWTVTQRYIFDEIMGEECAPTPPVFGMGMLAPVIMRYGTAAQKEHYLPRILNVEDWWCQGFSEPNAGSDLASLTTRGVRDGNEWVITGQKIWTTLAHQADWMFCLVRTSQEEKKQDGISLLLVPMNTPGITVKPIITIDGEHEVNEVFLDEVRVPAGNIIGEPGQGWTCAKYLLSQERTGIARVSQSTREIARLKTLAKSRAVGNGTLYDHPLFRARIARLEIALKALDITASRMISALSTGTARGFEASLLKIKGSELQQDISEALMDAAGDTAFRGLDHHAATDFLTAMEWDEHPEYLASAYFNQRKVTIYGGSNEIQRNILAKTMIGL
jgi:alkylation response protein AidB-like acyl-CoA dehydrogenase